MGERACGTPRHLWSGQPPQSDNRRAAPDALQNLHFHEEGVPGTAADRRVVVGVDVPNAAGHLAAETDRAHGAFELVVPDDDVLGGDVDPAAIRVPARLDGDGVVAGQQRAVLDHHVVAAFGVAAVAVHTPSGGLSRRQRLRACTASDATARRGHDVGSRPG